MDVEKLIPDAQTLIPKLTVLWWTLALLLGLALLVNATSGAVTESFISHPCLG